jgi:hypothetical protein
MAKDGTNSQYKYRVEWTGQTTGWNYRLDVIPSYNDTNNASLTVSNEAPDCLEDFEFVPYSYDKYYVGLGESPSLQLKIDLNRTSTNFASILCDPFITYAQNTTFNSDSLFPCHEQFTTGNIFELYIEYEGLNDGYVLVYRGTQITSLENYEVENSVLTIETEHIKKTIFSQMKFDDFLFLHSFYTQSSSNAVPNTSIEGVNYIILGHELFTAIPEFITTHFVSTNTTQYKGYFDNFQSFSGGIIKLARIIEKKIRRLSSYPDFSFSFGLPKLYKQSFLDTGERYTELAENQLKIISHVSTTALNTQSSFSSISSSDGVIFALKGEYDSVWDFMQDLSGSFIKKTYFDEQNSGIENRNIYSEDSITLSNVDIEDFKPSFFSDVSGKFSISAVEDHEQGADTVEVNVIGTRSSEALEFAAPLHNITALKRPDDYPANYLNYDNNFVIDQTSGYDLHSWTFNTVNNLCIYYKGTLIDKNGDDVLNDHTASTQDRYIHVHTSPKFEISTTISSDDYVNVYDEYPLFVDFGLDSEIFTSGNINGSYYIAAKTLSSLFSNNYQTKIEATIPINVGTYYDETNEYVVCPYINPIIYVNYDFSDIEPKTGIFSELPTKYEFVTSKITKDEKCEFTLLSRID